MLIENLNKGLEQIKNSAYVCDKRQKYIINKLAVIKEDILTTKEYLSNDEYFKNIAEKIKKLHMDNFIVEKAYANELYDDKLMCLYTGWVNKAYYEKFGAWYDGDFKFKLNFETLAKKLLNCNVVEKEIFTNVIVKMNVCTFRDENPYFCVYEDVYYPLCVKVLCPEDFDESKKYSIGQLQHLSKSGKIVANGILTLSKTNMVVAKYLPKLEKRKINFKLNNIKFKATDDIKVVNQEYFAWNRNEHKRNFLINMMDFKDVFSYDKKTTLNEEINKVLTKCIKIYPNFLTVFDECLKEAYVDSVKTEKEKLNFLIEQYKITLSNYINEIKKSIQKISNEIDKIDVNGEQIQDL